MRRWLAGFQSHRTKLGRKQFLLWVQSLMLFFSFFFSLLPWNQDDDGKLKAHLLTSLSILPELTCSCLLTHKCFVYLGEQLFKLVTATVKKRATAHLLLLKFMLLYFLLRYRVVASLTEGPFNAILIAGQKRELVPLNSH